MLATIINEHLVTEKEKIGSWKKLKAKKESVTNHQECIPLIYSLVPEKDHHEWSVLYLISG